MDNFDRNMIERHAGLWPPPSNADIYRSDRLSMKALTKSEDSGERPRNMPTSTLTFMITLSRKVKIFLLTMNCMNPVTSHATHIHFAVQSVVSNGGNSWRNRPWGKWSYLQAKQKSLLFHSRRFHFLFESYMRS